ncbi:hypothetical protein ACGFI3_43395, partial [Nonomuraea wenchangensis]|uniref:hypothetical protein n=1 Tax=Nonomuraea wenchangensis TaxID=568860 RepID=UPI003724139F
TLNACGGDVRPRAIEADARESGKRITEILRTAYSPSEELVALTQDNGRVLLYDPVSGSELGRHRRRSRSCGRRGVDDGSGVGRPRFRAAVPGDLRAHGVTPVIV